MTGNADPFAAKRAAMRSEFFSKLFLLGGWVGGTDTYKRTMWAAVPEVALAEASYALTFRRGLPEPGAGEQLVMAGHEAVLAQWFARPLLRGDIELARRWYSERSAVLAFPHELWDAVLDLHPGTDEVRLPVDVWGFPGGQTFRAGVPAVVFEGVGGAVSYLEPAMCRYFAPVIQATKARLMREATPRDAEFGLRSAPVEVCNFILLLARYVGGAAGADGVAEPMLTSNDSAEFVFPELFRSVGTIGHELVCAGQSFDRTLAEAERDMLDRFVSRMGTASLLCDLVDAESVGLENALRVIKDHPETDRVGVRVDSGDIAGQCVRYYQALAAAGVKPRLIVFEDEVTPDTVRTVYAAFRAATGVEPTMLFPGAGGYWWRLVHRDTVSAAFKRTATGNKPNVKFSNSPGKESLPGRLRVFGRGDTLVVADRDETVDGEPLFVKLVDRGRIVYAEPFAEQAHRAAETWSRTTRTELSPRVQGDLDRFRAMRAAEVAASRGRLGVG